MELYIMGLSLLLLGGFEKLKQLCGGCDEASYTQNGLRLQLMTNVYF